MESSREKERKEVIKKLRSIIYQANLYGWTKRDIIIELRDYVNLEVVEEGK